MLKCLLAVAAFAALVETAPSAGPTPAFDGYAFGMSVIDAEHVPPNRKALECGRLMTSGCIVYERHLGAFAATVTVQFSLDDRRIDRIEIVPRGTSDRGGASCDAAWTDLVTFLSKTYGGPRSREGNTMHWHAGALNVTATVLQEEGAFCDVMAALTPAGRQP